MPGAGSSGPTSSTVPSTVAHSQPARRDHGGAGPGPEVRQLAGTASSDERDDILARRGVRHHPHVHQRRLHRTVGAGGGHDAEELVDGGDAPEVGDVGHAPVLVPRIGAARCGWNLPTAG